MSSRHDRQSRTLDQYLEREVAERLDEGLAAVAASGQKRELSILFADIRGFTRFSEANPPETVFETLNIYLGAMIPPVLDQRGMLDKVIGDEIMALFGMAPADVPAPLLAVRAAHRMLSDVSRLNYQRDRKGLPVLFVGIGIATGPVSLGVLGSNSRRWVTVIGNHVNLASRLQSHANANQVLVDSNTFRALGDQGKGFNERFVELKGYSAPVPAHVYELPLG
jgi:class 3 adenylate cyclase